MPSSFTTLAGDPLSPCVLHVPHSSMQIPPEVRAGILLDDAALDAELRAMTDVHTDLIAAGAADLAAGVRPWTFVNRLSRLVVDPERFPDEREVMNAVGMGAVYTRTSTGARLRDEDPGARTELIRTRFDPYASALADLVDARVEAAGSAVIVDIHSYPLKSNAYELYPDEPRPQVCLGFDEQHTPECLRAAAHKAFTASWSVGANGPFHGTYVPLRHHGSDDRVASVMIEIRRDVYVSANGAPLRDAISQLATAIAALVDAVS